jgi:hypothetical protein
MPMIVKMVAHSSIERRDDVLSAEFHPELAGDKLSTLICRSSGSYCMVVKN